MNVLTNNMKKKNKLPFALKQTRGKESNTCMKKGQRCPFYIFPEDDDQAMSAQQLKKEVFSPVKEH